MVISERYLTLLICIIIFTGCAPLEQAPLVYSSKSVVGIDISATATEQPGLSVNVGYKQVDAAYVPVAVAKSCDFDYGDVDSSDKTDTTINTEANSNTKANSNVNCTNEIYKLLTIAGNNKVEDSRSESDEIKEAKKHLEEFKGIGASRDIANKALSDAQIKFKAAVAAKEAFDKINPPTNSDNDAQIKLERLTKSKEVTAAEDAVKVAEKNLNSARLAFDSIDASKLLNAFNIAGLDNNKQDAYSVFGSFDANTKTVTEANGGNANVKADTGLALGKVFSTGVAAQHLTEGMKNYYEHDGEAKVAAAKAYGCLVHSENYLNSFKSQLDMGNPEDKQRLIKMQEDLITICKGK
ncbi:hypothetical protein [Cellvibrio sp. NN19]|uniref:hypothetical protein n=1 Tax=Cellvibrio chitinivorans TaxID=3102792 RepID=UPI002B412956|nr:hypothetical protein [Cellvibrio sp. NN19]